jgi:hypothetical protein
MQFGNFKDVDDYVIVVIITVFIAFILVIAGIYIMYVLNLQSRQCSAMDTLYPGINGKIRSVIPNDTTLNQYYIKTAYNCCSLGSYKNDFVGLCSLTNILKQGVRGLDFEIFSIDDKPVIATSMSTNYYTKDTYNSIPFHQAMHMITNNAFTTQYCANSNDPIIIHLRFKSNNINMYNNLAKIFTQYQRFLIGANYKYTNTNLSNTKLSELMGKIIIMVDETNKTFEESTTLCEFINMTSNSANMRLLHFYDIKYGDHNELTNHNKKNMTICIPDKNTTPSNPDITVLQNTKCNMFAMCYQRSDKYLEKNNKFFDDAGYAFILKRN